MKSARFFFLGFLLLVSSALAYADAIPVDPVMDVSDPICFEGCPPAIEGTTFSFAANAFGGGVIKRTNRSGVDWTSLLIAVTTNGGTLPPVAPADITCTSNAFINCQKSVAEGGVTNIYLYGVGLVGEVAFFPGLVNNDAFTINLNDLVRNALNPDPNGSGGWGGGRIFEATANAANPVPEPATLTLLCAGIGALVVKRRFRRQARS
jgi:hypothetical protein